ncbi:MAG: hypothetical protein CMM94_08055 [Rickettsiales bacterium]|nr:hypothetical protein [Rickettsiales bacterium]
MKRLLPRLPFGSPDIPFAREDAHRILPWIIAFMLCLTAMMLALTISLTQNVSKQQQQYDHDFQVEVPYQDNDMDDKVAKVADEVRLLSGVRSVTRITQSDMAELITPWMGESALLATLPMPALLEVDVDVAKLENGKLDLNKLQTKLQAIVKDVTVQQPRAWLEEFAAFTDALRVVSVLLAVLLLTCTIAIIVLTARTSLKLHFKTVSILHSIGAKDEYILTQFQLNGVLLTMKGALIGTAIAFVLFLALQVLTTHALSAPIIPTIEFTLMHAALFFFLPLFAALVTFFATRLTIGAMLQQMH